MSRFLDQLLRPEVQSVQDALPTAEYEIKRLSRLCGEPVTVTLKALPYGRTQDLKDMKEDVEIHILLAGCRELGDPALQQKFGGATPVENIKAMLLPGEIEDLSRAVERLTGYRMNTIREVKNESGRAETRI